MSIKKHIWSGLIIGTCIAAQLTCRATLSFVGNAYVELQANGGANTYYWVNQSDGVNPQFSGSLVSIGQGQSLMLGGQAQTYQPQLGTSVTMHYTINNYSTQPTINLGYAGSRGNNDLWDTSEAVNIANGLSAGTYTLDVWYSANNGGTTIFDNNGGSNFAATFTVTAVPEPVTVALAVFGGLITTAGMLRFLKLRSSHLFVLSATGNYQM